MNSYVTTLDQRIRPADCGCDPSTDEQLADFLFEFFRSSDRVQRETYADLDPAIRDAIDRERAAAKAAVLGTLDACLDWEWSFDCGKTVLPRPECQENARAALAQEFGTDKQRREKRAPMRAPR